MYRLHSTIENGVKCEVIESKVPTVFHTGDVTQASDHLPIYVDVKIPKINISFTEQTLSPARCCRGERFSPPIGKMVDISVIHINEIHKNDVISY